MFKVKIIIVDDTDGIDELVGYHEMFETPDERAAYNYFSWLIGKDILGMEIDKARARE